MATNISLVGRVVCALAMAVMCGCEVGLEEDLVAADAGLGTIEASTPIQVRSTSAASSGSRTTTSLSVAKPAGTAANDTLIAALAVNDAAVIITPPTGWSLIYRKNVDPGSGSTLALVSFRRVAGAAEPGAYAFGLSSGRAVNATITSFVGVDPAESVQHSGRIYTTATAAPATPSSFDISEDNTMVVTLFANATAVPAFATWTPPTGETERADIHTTRSSGSGNVSLEVNTFASGAAGIYGPFSATPSSTGIAATQILSLVPAVTTSPSRFYGDPGPGKVYVGAANGFGTIEQLMTDLKPYNGNVSPVTTAERIYASKPSSLGDSNNINLPAGVRADVDAALAAGRLPVITSKWYAPGRTSILAGNVDASHIKPLADYFKSLAPRPVVFAPWHEMAGDSDFSTGSDYTTVFRYIIERLRSYGVTNMTVAWVPTSLSITSGAAASYYPGDDVVDIIGADGYNFYTDLGYPGLSGPEFQNRWRDCRSIFQATVDFGRAHGKPLGVFELGTPTATDLAHVKDRWKTTNDNQGSANLNQHAGKTLAQINDEWWNGPGGIPWLVDNGLVLLTYWSSGGNNTGFEKSWRNGTYSLTRRGTNNYAAPYNVQTEASSPRADRFVDVLNASYVTDYQTVLGL